MYKTAALLILLASNAYADRLEMPNHAGGKIVLTENKCPGNPKLNASYSYTKEGLIYRGCWAFFDDRIFVATNSSQGAVEVTYSLDDFTLIRENPAPNAPIVKKQGKDM